MDMTLAHHGIKGQKWGIRRFQPYPKGGRRGKEVGEAARSSDPYDDLPRKYQKGAKTIEQKRAEDRMRYDYANRSSLTMEELNQKITRLKAEQELRTLTQKQLSPGRAFVDEVMRDAGKKALTTAATGVLLYSGKAFVSKEFDAKELGNAIFNGGPKKK